MFNEQKKYFKKKLKGIQCMIWDLEFKRFKTKEIREEVRHTYDNGKARLLSLETTIKLERDKAPDASGKMLEGDIARLEDEAVRLKRDIERYEAQVKHLDVEIEGSRPTNEYPDGVNGITQQLDSLQELKGMVSEYIRSL